MTMPTNQCPWRMQVHHITQETPDVWTISLICHDYYPYRAGQYALVSVRNSAETLRAYQAPYQYRATNRITMVATTVTAQRLLIIGSGPIFSSFNDNEHQPAKRSA